MGFIVTIVAIVAIDFNYLMMALMMNQRCWAMVGRVP